MERRLGAGHRLTLLANSYVVAAKRANAVIRAGVGCGPRSRDRHEWATNSRSVSQPDRSRPDDPSQSQSGYDRSLHPHRRVI